MSNLRWEKRMVTVTEQLVEVQKLRYFLQEEYSLEDEFWRDVPGGPPEGWPAP